jgi:hypothetical protein
LLRVPLHEVARWPQPELDLYAAFLAKEPAPDERIEIAVAQLTALGANMMRGRGQPAKSTADFLLFRDPWGELPSTADRQIASTLDTISRKRKKAQ